MAGLGGLGGLFGGRRATDFPRQALDISVQDRKVVEVHHGAKPFKGGTQVTLRHIDARGAHRDRVFHMTKEMAMRAGWQAGMLPGVRGIFGRIAAILQQHKVKIWYLMLFLVTLYLFYGCIAIHEEATYNGLRLHSKEETALLLAAYPKFLFNALITSLANLFSGEMQFPVMIISLLLIFFVFDLTFVRRR